MGILSVSSLPVENEYELQDNEFNSISFDVIKLDTVGTARRDRYTSNSYGNYFISLLELDLLKNTNDDYDFVFSYS